VKGDIEVDRSELARVFFRITTFGQSPGIVKGLLFDLPFDALSHFWDRYIDCPSLGVFSFAEARVSSVNGELAVPRRADPRVEFRLLSCNAAEPHYGVGR
jgi:hypothetical protein